MGHFPHCIVKYAWYVCLCGGDVNAKVIHVPASVYQGPATIRATLREKKSDDSDFPDFFNSHLESMLTGGIWVRKRIRLENVKHTTSSKTGYKLLQKLDQVAAPSVAILENSCLFLETKHLEFPFRFPFGAQNISMFSIWISFSSRRDF